MTANEGVRRGDDREIASSRSLARSWATDQDLNIEEPSAVCLLEQGLG